MLLSTLSTMMFDNTSFTPNSEIQTGIFLLKKLECVCEMFKLQLGALIPRFVGLSVSRLVRRSSKNYKKITKLYKTLQNVTKHYKTLQNQEKWSYEDCQGSFAIFLLEQYLHCFCTAGWLGAAS